MNEVLIKDLPSNSKPRERLMNYGKENISDEELLAIILRCGYKNVNVKSLSLNMLKEIGTLSNLKDITLKELTSIKGIGLTKAISILASIELGKRVYFDSNKNKVKLNNSNIIYEKYNSYFIDKKQEILLCLYLDKSFHLIEEKVLFKGTIDKSLIHPREIFKYAVKLSSSYFVLIHNHPSGNIEPSNDDIYITQNINELSKMMGIKLIDHIIISSNGYISFKEAGIFN